MVIEMENLIKLLDNFQYELSDYVGDNKYFVVDNHIELAQYLVGNNVIVQKHGQWIQDEDSICCSVCGFKTSSYIPYVCDGERWLPLYKNKYCGNCGALMDGGKNENL